MSDYGYIMKIYESGYHNVLDVGCERRREVKNGSKVFVLSN